MSGLFANDPAITRLAPDKSSPLWVHVIVGRQRVARAPAARAPALGLCPGALWTPELARLTDLACETLRAKLKAVALLKVRSRSSKELSDRLRTSGFSPQATAQALAELRGEKLIDDQALAGAKAGAALAKGLSGSAVRKKLSSAGLSLPPSQSPAADLQRAIEQARNRAARLPESLGAPARYRRLLSALARLGYDEDVAQEAAADAIGAPIED